MNKKMLSIALVATTISTSMLTTIGASANEKNNNYNSVLESVGDSENVKVQVYEFTYKNAPEELKAQHEENCNLAGIQALDTDIIYSANPEYAKAGEPRNVSILREGSYFVVASMHENFRVKISTIKSGSRGNLVKVAQLLLIRSGRSLAADGIFGAKTVSATKSFQKSKGLTADGIIGTNTWNKLDDYCY